MRVPTKGTSSGSCVHWRQEHSGVGPHQSLTCLRRKSRDQPSIWGHPRASEVDCDSQLGKGSWQLRSEKNVYYYSYILICSVVGSGFLFFLLLWLLILLLLLTLFKLLRKFFIIVFICSFSDMYVSLNSMLFNFAWTCYICCHFLCVLLQLFAFVRFIHIKGLYCGMFLFTAV